jgi:predicted TIM-barrel fold metal-dependent hydrolase
MKVIDFHTHVYPEKIAAKATKAIADFYNLEGGILGTADMLLKEGEKVGIDKYVILPVAINPLNVRHLNEATLGETKLHKEFIGFGTIHASMDNIMGEIEYIEKTGLRGVKMHPDFQLFSIDDNRLFEMYDYLQDKMPVILHTGDPRYDYSRPDKLKKVLDNFPRLTVIAAHLGGYGVFSEALEILGKTDCYVDISSSRMFMEEEEIYRYIHGYGADRILFGSDFPLWSPKDEFEALLKLKITDEEKEKIAYKNAERLLNL